jgi:hypothetical protein
MSEDTVVNPYESVASDATAQLTRVKALASSFEQKLKGASEQERQAIVADGLLQLWKEVSGTAFSLIADVSALTRDLDEGLSGVEEAIDNIAEIDTSTSESDEEDDDSEEDEEGDTDVNDNDEVDGEDTGDSQLETDHAEALKFLLTTLKTMLEAAVTQPALDPQQKSELQTIVGLCVKNIKFIDDVTLVDDDEEGSEEDDEDDE